MDKIDIRFPGRCNLKSHVYSVKRMVGEIEGHKQMVSSLKCVWLGVLAENLRIFDYSNCKGKVILIYSHLYAGRHLRVVSVNILKRHSHSFGFEECAKSHGMLICVNGESYKAQCELMAKIYLNYEGGFKATYVSEIRLTIKIEAQSVADSNGPRSR